MRRITYDAPIAAPAASVRSSNAAVTPNSVRHAAATWSTRSGPAMMK
jgi:hypothetical protein